MPERDRNKQKRQDLRLQGTLNPRPQGVTHALFRDSDFFDPHDLVQVKYEMLRQVRIDKRPVSHSAKAFGFSRPSLYQAQSTFEQSGLAGLVPKKRGPRSGHKLRPKVMALLTRTRAAEPSLGTDQLAELVEKRFGIQVHPRSIERQLRRPKKGR